MNSLTYRGPLVTRIEIDFPTRPDEIVMAYANIVLLDRFAIEGIRILRNGASYHVAMPDRQRRVKCAGCSRQIGILYRYCQHCGEPQPIPEERPEYANLAVQGVHGRNRIHLDVAHPTRREVREEIKLAVLGEFFRQQGQRPIHVLPPTAHHESRSLYS